MNRLKGLLAVASATIVSANVVAIPAASAAAARVPADVAGAPLVVASVGFNQSGGLAGTGAVTVINTANNVAGPAVKVGVAPVALVVSPNGATAYVVGASNDDTGAPGTLTPVNTVTHAVGKAVKLPDPIEVAVPSTGNTVYVLDGFEADIQPVGTPSNLYPVNTATGAVGKVVKVASNPTATVPIVLTPNGKELYVLGTNEVTPVTTAPLAASAPLKIAATAVVISPNSNTAYFMQPGKLTVVVVATATNTRDKTIGTGQFVPEALALSPNGQDLYVVGAPDAALGGGPDDDLLVYNTATGALLRTVSLGAHADNGFVIALTPSGGEAYVLGYGQLATQGWVVPVNTSTGSSGALIHVGFNASAIVAAPSGKWVYVLDNGVPPGGETPKYTGSVVPIDVATGEAGKAVPVVAYAEIMATT